MKRFSLILATCLFTASIASAQGVNPRLDSAPNDPNGAILEYNPVNGDFRVYQLGEATRAMTTLEITSEAGVFDGPGSCPVFGLFDINSPNKVFRLDPAGFSEYVCDQAVRPGLTLDVLANDLKVAGSLVGGGPIPDAVFLIPEPSASGLLLIGLGMFCARHRRRIA